MKNIFKFLASMAVAVAMIGFTSCEPDPEPEPQPQPQTYELDPIENVGTLFAFHFNGQTVEPGATVTYNATTEDINDNFAAINLYIENLGNEEVTAIHRIEIAEGPADMNEYEVCAGGSCPWNGEPYTLVPGMNNDKPITLEFFPADHATHATALFRVAVTTSRNDNATYILVARDAGFTINILQTGSSINFACQATYVIVTLDVGFFNG